MSCEECGLRARYDKNPKSILGRLWRWHIGFCPGWKSYMAELSPADRERLVTKYNIKRKK
jgi:hypothetical protein